MAILGRLGTERWPRWLRFALPAALAVILAWTAFLWWRSFTGNAGLPEAPGPARAGSEIASYDSSFLDVSQPMGVAVSPDGQRIYVSNSSGDRTVSVFDPDGNLIQSLAPPDTSAAARVPVYLAVDSGGRLFVTDREQAKIFVYDTEGNFTGTFPSSPPADWHPLGVSVDNHDNVYVTDVTPDRHRIIVFGPDGSQRLEFGTQGSGQGQFWFPNAVAVDQQGRIYVADSNNGRVQYFSADGTYIGELGRGLGPGDLELPRGLAIDPQGRMYVVDIQHQDVAVYQTGDGAPVSLGSFGSEGAADGQFEYPNGIALDGNGRLYITDKDNGRVQVWEYPQ